MSRPRRAVATEMQARMKLEGVGFVVGVEGGSGYGGGGEDGVEKVLEVVGAVEGRRGCQSSRR